MFFLLWTSVGCELFVSNLLQGHFNPITDGNQGVDEEHAPKIIHKMGVLLREGDQEWHLKLAKREEMQFLVNWSLDRFLGSRPIQ